MGLGLLDPKLFFALSGTIICWFYLIVPPNQCEYNGNVFMAHQQAVKFATLKAFERVLCLREQSCLLFFIIV